MALPVTEPAPSKPTLTIDPAWFANLSPQPGLDVYRVAPVHVVPDGLAADALVALSGDPSSPIRVLRLAKRIALDSPVPGIATLDGERMLNLKTGKERALAFEHAALSPDGTRLAGTDGVNAIVIDRATLETIEIGRPMNIKDAASFERAEGSYATMDVKGAVPLWAPDGSFVIYVGSYVIFVLADGRITLDRPDPDGTGDVTFVKARGGWRVAYFQAGIDPRFSQVNPHVVLLDPLTGIERSSSLGSPGAKMDRLLSTSSYSELYAIAADYSPETLDTHGRAFSPVLFRIDVATGGLTSVARGKRRDGYGLSNGGVTAGGVACYRVNFGEQGPDSCEAEAFFNIRSGAVVAPGTRCILDNEVAYDLLDPPHAAGRDVPESIMHPLLPRADDGCNQALSPDAALFGHVERETSGGDLAAHLVVSERTSGKVLKDVALPPQVLPRDGRRQRELGLKIEFDKDGKGIIVTDQGDPVHVDLDRGAVDAPRIATEPTARTFSPSAILVDDTVVESYLLRARKKQ